MRKIGDCPTYVPEAHSRRTTRKSSVVSGDLRCAVEIHGQRAVDVRGLQHIAVVDLNLYRGRAGVARPVVDVAITVKWSIPPSPDKIQVSIQDTDICLVACDVVRGDRCIEASLTSSCEEESVALMAIVACADWFEVQVPFTTQDESL